MISTLKERVSLYEEAYDYKIIKKLPIIICLNGRSFKKITSLLEKPFSTEFQEIMCAVSLKLMQEIDGVVIAYSFNDEIILILRNDQSIDTEAWYDNHIQKIVSAAASIATLEFNRLVDIGEVKMMGDPIFIANCFAVPNLIECINFLISKQQQANQSSVSMACFYELIKKFNIEIVKKTIQERTLSEKLEILSDQCGVDYNKYPLSFRQGIAVYRTLKMVRTSSGDELRKKMVVDTELPIFTKNHDFLSMIFKGQDIIREGKNY